MDIRKTFSWRLQATWVENRSPDVDLRIPASGSLRPWRLLFEFLC